ncbi:MAG TPA: type I-F CRISPR-associated protein Csy3 [Rhodocyclaceae bacterium]|nr:type I-F CRISPR-associated protein Csy3 [Rhodocyclaceae bacterium]
MQLAPMKKLPGVLAFNRCHLVTDGEMFSRLADGRDIPVPVIRHGLRGTQNVNDGKGNDNPKTAASGERKISNVQMTETAKLDPQATALVVRFGLALLDLGASLDACVAADHESGKTMRASVDDFVARAKQSEGLIEVARRYARNIANGRWLWRNRSIAAAIRIDVAKKSGGVVTRIASFDAKSIPLNIFESYSGGEQALAEELAAQLRGDSLDGLLIEAVVSPRIEGNLEVFPSQNYVERKPDGFARPLYKLGHPAQVEMKSPSTFTDTRLMGYAALRDQKIFNAIRTIDTWYPAFADTLFPIPVEPRGANLSQQEFYRKGKDSSFDLFKRLPQIDPDSAEGMFCIAALDRGGVYGESDKAEKSASKAVAETPAEAE